MLLASHSCGLQLHELAGEAQPRDAYQRACRPATTLLGVSRLLFPGQLMELEATAVASEEHRES